MSENLNDTTDAMAWAEEFCRIFDCFTIHRSDIEYADSDRAVDEGTMVTWFANAIETGRSAGRKETCPHDDVFAVADDMSSCRKCGKVFSHPPLRTKSGKVLTDDDIQALADEAEAGYDVSHLKPRINKPEVW